MTWSWRSLVAMTAGLLCLSLPAALHPKPRLVWNASPSAPIGLYGVRTRQRPQRGDLVIVQPTSRLSDYLEGRGYLPRGVPLLKHIAARSGQRVCRAGLTVTIDGRAAAAARRRDHLGRPLPVWRGCVRLTEDEVFLLNPGVPDSLDGRYFGPTQIRQILGVAHPIWTPPKR